MNETKEYVVHFYINSCVFGCIYLIFYYFPILNLLKLHTNKSINYTNTYYCIMLK